MTEQNIQPRLPLLVVAGPTASGKTGFGVELAKRWNGEVISADSMQIYKNMNVGTAKATEEEMQGIPHHMLDFLEPNEQFSVADFVAMASAKIEEIVARGKLPIVVGGTGLYISSLVDNLTFSPMPQSPELREQLKRKAAEEGNDAVLEELRSFDPEAAEKLHANNLGRVIRAIEVYRLTGVTMTETVKNSHKEPSPYRLCMIALTAEDRQFLYDRIDRRVDIMVEQGVVEEAKQLYNMPLSSTARQAIGYKEFDGFIEGTASLQECIEKLKMETRRYAKRQLTWFRRDERYHWLEVDHYTSAARMAEAAEEWIRNDLGI
ncbi:MAG: tRNA (adenosine(37)-N6)-dimethylallyltransferase MiaA [Oscillospiraceae bacterium]|nr:tRNA (adenosine(37)-N6)-dimethylallyltransferase MiaA [Oscillospiraceae bacterium]